MKKVLLILLANLSFAQNWNPKDNMSLNMYVRAWDGTIATNGVVNSLTDLTGNGNNLTAIGGPTIVPNGIGGLQSIRFNGNNRLELINPISGITDLSKRAGWIVYKIEEPNGVSYHNIIMLGASSYSNAGTTYLHLYNPNLSNDFMLNLHVNSLDITNATPQLSPNYAIFEKSNNTKLNINGSNFSSASASQNVNNNNLFVGQWFAKGAKMIFSEMAILDNNVNTISPANLANLENYFFNTYGIAKKPKVVNAGVSGNNTSDVINRLAAINANDCDLAVVMIGTNDWNHSSASQRRTPTQYKNNLTTIVQSLKNAGSQVLLLNFPPVLESETTQICSYFCLACDCDVNSTSIAIREKILEVATEQNVLYYDLKQDFINVNQPTNLSSSYMQCIANVNRKDGIHPSAAGMDFIATKIKNYLTSNSLNFNSYIFIGDSITFGFGVLPNETFPVKFLSKF